MVACRDRTWRRACASFLLLRAPLLGADDGDFLIVENTPFMVESPAECVGEQQEYRECNDRPCEACKPEVCEFNDWSEWVYGGECTGLMKRTRTVKTYGNTCGSICNGDLVETTPGVEASVYLQNCVQTVTNATFTAWGEWSACNGDFQMTRKREAVAPANGGSAEGMDGALEEMVPCGQYLPTDCRLSDWDVWTACTLTCDAGRTSRQRHVEMQATKGGTPCNGTLWENKVCNTQTCVVDTDCQLGLWSDWFGCNDGQPEERYRERTIAVQAQGDGLPCGEDGGAAHLRQLTGCTETRAPQQCVLSLWGEWAACDRTCTGGQTYRLRHVVTDSEWGGTCPQTDLKELKDCNADVSCTSTNPDIDCLMADWSAWSPCSSNCGKGLTTRTRAVTQLAKDIGQGCADSTKEVMTCEVKSIEECGPQDCTWGDWDPWSDCSMTCGGGSMHRARVIAQSPRNGGALCGAADKSEVGACGTQACDNGCQQGLWGDWAAWSQCSTTCDQGYTSRHREVVQYPDDCGEPAVGPSEEVAVCTAPAACFPPTDCSLSQWTLWSDCTSECKGIRERTRHIAVYAAGGGAPCAEDSLKELVPCSPGVGEVPPPGCGDEEIAAPCTFNDWGSWQACDVTCGGGQSTRSRTSTQATGNGPQCSGSTSEVAPCGTQACATGCVDCAWDDWGDWDSCTHCSNEKKRLRNIRTMPNHCGAICQPGDEQEVANCSSTCTEDNWCVWSTWQQLNPCDATQCAGTQTKQRSLITVSTLPADGFLFKAEGLITCSGSEVTLERCPSPPTCNKSCVPEDCQWADWSEWTNPSCEGLCERQRVIMKPNNGCGTPCQGPMISSKKCDANCTVPQDCLLSEWHMWSTCQTGGEGEQRTRVRSISHYPMNGGAGCSGDLTETKSCFTDDLAVDCVISDWSDWLDCTKTCGNGYQIRHRQILNHATGGGLPCNDDILHELQPCGAQECEVTKVDCVLSDWSPWSCKSGEAGGQMDRHRDVLKLAEGGGLDCGEVDQGPGLPRLPVNTSLEETMPCPTTGPVDCVLSNWTRWSQCTATCGGGQTQLHRVIETPAKNGGAPCPQDWVKIEPCGMDPCSVDRPCEVSLWSDWGACSSSCGAGIKQRSRGVKTLATGNGARCNERLSESVTCISDPSAAACAAIHCVWPDWEDWSGCTRTCDGGSKHRNRAPTAPVGATACDVAPESEIVPCGTVSCDAVNCVDATWGAWSEWSACSASCDGGITTRSRAEASPANDCGAQLDGATSEIMSCNMQVSCTPSADCLISDWTVWGACTTYAGYACDGHMERARTMSLPTGIGAHCDEGVPLKEMVGCHSQALPDGSPCPAPGDKVDCMISDWADWSACSVSCGTGHFARNKVVLVEPANGGLACTGATQEMQECSLQECPAGQTLVNCTLSDWSAWTGCETCGSQQSRTRGVAAWPQNGGAGCTGTTEQISACNVTCRESQGDWCVYGAWAAWSSCSVSCGPGRTSRSRHLQSTNYAEAQALAATQLWDSAGAQGKLNSMLSERTQNLESRHRQKLVLTFGCGVLSVLFTMGAFRVCGRSGLQRQSYDSLMRMATVPPEESHASREPLNAMADEEEGAGTF